MKKSIEKMRVAINDKYEDNLTEGETSTLKINYWVDGNEFFHIFDN